MTRTIYSCSLTEGRSHLQYHAERPDGTAACSSYLNVSRDKPAATIDKQLRCKSRACQKLFAEADATPLDGAKGER